MMAMHSGIFSSTHPITLGYDEFLIPGLVVVFHAGGTGMTEVRIPPLTRTEAEARKRSILGNPTYQVHLTLGEGDEQTAFRSETTISFDAVEGSSTFIDLVAESVEEIVLNGKTLPPSAWKDGRIALDGLGAANTLKVVARCPYRQGGMGMQRTIDPEDGNTYLYTQGEAFEIHSVFACFDQPDIKGTFDLAVTAPANWTVATNTPEARKEAAPDGSIATWTFDRSPVMSTYLATFLAGPYHKVTDSSYTYPMELYCRKAMAKYLTPEPTFQTMRMAVDYYEKRFGLPYPFPKLGLAWVPDFTFGAMENPGLMTFVERTLPRGAVSATQLQYQINVLFHELGHMWFGDRTTMQWWNDLWLNESFATFVSHRGQDEATPFKVAAVDFATRSKAAASAADQKPSTHPISVPVEATNEIWSNFDRITYEKGSSVLQQLERYVGDAFWKGIHTYLVDRSYSNATRDDLLHHLEKASGVSLARWAKVWLEEPGINTLRAQFTAKNGVYDRFVIEQGAAKKEYPTLRPHRLKVGLYDLTSEDKLVLRESIPVSVDGASTVCKELVGKKTADLVLLNDDDWTFAKVAFDPASLAAVKKAIHTLDSPLARTLCNSTLWNMTRDGEFPVREFVDVMCAQAHESVPSVLEALLARAQTAIRLYADPDERDTLQGKLHDTASAMLKESEGTPFHISWFEVYLATASAQKDIAHLKHLLTGKETLPGIVLAPGSDGQVDQDMRWKILGRLAALGAVTDSTIRKEELGDDSVLGRVQAQAVRAARPTAAAKRQAWKELMADGITIAEARAVGQAFWQPEQENLLRPYYGKLAAAITTWNDRREEQTLDNLVSYALPLQPDAAVVKEITTALAVPKVSEAVKRQLRDLRDDIERALHCREENTLDGKGSRSMGDTKQ